MNPLNPQKDQALLIVQAARQTLSDPTKWTKGKLAKNSQGEWTEPTGSEAVCWCFVGAIEKHGLDAQDSVYAVMVDALERIKLPRMNGSITQFNDHKDTTHSEVLEVFDLLISHLKQ
jgi:hypothetical protein